MKKILFLILLSLIFSQILLSQTVNGDTLTIDGKKILKIWGTHSERGYAYGYLMGDAIKDVAENYVLASVFANSAYVYSFARTYFLSHFSVEEVYHDEVAGMIAGMQDAGIDLHSSVLGRDLDETDLLVANSIVDLSSRNLTAAGLHFGCSGLSSWGTSTQADADLQGNSVITRNLDWTPDETLLNNHLLVVNFPSEPDETAWISFTFAGMIGALSAIGENGIAAFMDVGNYNIVVDENNLHPIFFSIRNGLEKVDYNADGETNQFDVYQAISDKTHLSPSIVHIVNSQFGIVVETNNNAGTVFRDETDNTIIPLNNLAATNHFRKLYAPVYCDRYAAIADSLNNDANVSVQRSWDILAGAAGVSINLQTIEFAPTLNLTKWSTAKAGIPAYSEEPTVFETSNLFSCSEVENHSIFPNAVHIAIYPNPFHSQISVSIDCENSPISSKQAKIEIYNIKGQKIKQLRIKNYELGINKITWNGTDSRNNKLESGIYLFKISTGSSYNLKKVLFLK